MSNTKEAEDFLAHHGVLGMKWGKHLPGRSGSKRMTPSTDHAEAHSLAKQPISTLTTSELQKVNSRLQAEKKYKDLNPNTVKKGHNVVKGIIAAGGTITALTALSQTPAGKAAIRAGTSAVSKFLAGNGKHVLIVAAKTAKHL